MIKNYNPVTKGGGTAALLNAMRIKRSVSGSIASFDDGADGVSVDSLKINIEPVQNLNGYDHPWPAGGGKNLLNIQDGTSTVSGVTITKKNGVITLNGTSTGSINYHLQDNMNLPEAAYIINLSADLPINSTIAVQTSVGNRSATAEGTTFTASMTGFCWIYIAQGVTFDNVSTAPMIRLASETDSTFKPYSNICPITGWTGVKVMRTGKNLYHRAIANAYLSTTTGQPEANSGYEVSEFIPVKKGQKVYILASGSARRWFYDLNKNPVKYLNISGDQIYTPTADGFIRVTLATTSPNYGTYQIEYGDSKTDYEPFGTTYDITFPSEAGTVYGGSLAVNEDGSGTLSITWAKDVFDGSSDESYTIGGSLYGAKFIVNTRNRPSPSTSSSKLSGVKSNYLKEVTQGSSWGKNGTFSRITNSASQIYATIDKTSRSVAELRAYFNEYPLEFAYPLATPKTYSLTTAQVTTLLGTNNIWADTGDVEVNYIADVTKVIEKLEAAINSTSG